MKPRSTLTWQPRTWAFGGADGALHQGEDRRQGALLAEYLDDYVGEENPVRVIDVRRRAGLGGSGFERVRAAATGRPGDYPASMLKLYLYGCLNQVQSGRRLEREARRNAELMWLLGKLAPDFKTIADVRRDNGEAIRATCAAFVGICRQVGLLQTSKRCTALDFTSLGLEFARKSCRANPTGHVGVATLNARSGAGPPS